MRIEEIQELLGDFENRLLELESSQHIHLKEDIKPEPEWTVRQYDMLEQLKSEIVGWRKKHAELLLKVDNLLADFQKPKKSKYLYK